MPYYHVLSRLRKQDDYLSHGLIYSKGARGAFTAFKKWCKNNNENIDTLREYQIYPISHARIWSYNKKWKIDSFFGHHDAKQYRKNMSAAMRKAHKQKQQIKRS